jgi:hypothetical protein
MAQYGQEALAATLEQLSDLPFTITNFYLANDIVRYRTRTLVLNYRFVAVPASCGDGGGKRMRLATSLGYCSPVQFVLSLLADQNAHS